MKRVYYLLSIGLLSAIGLTSCGEDEIVNENTGGGDDAAGELADYTLTASIRQSEALGRANIQEGVYAWNSEDAFTLLNRNTGKSYRFAISSAYNAAQPKAEAEFVGQAAVKNGHKVIAVFPEKEIKAFNEVATFTMPEVCTQTAGAAELKATTYMIAAGNVADNKIPALAFSPLTALVQFNLTNTSDRELKIRTITMETDDNVFPAEVKINDNGEVKSYSGMRKKVILDMQGQALAVNGTLNGYVNLLPTTYGDSRLIGSNAPLSITVNVLNNDQEQDIILLKEVPMKDLKDKIGLDMDASAYQFAAGRLYKMDFELDYRFKVPEEGYLIDDDGNIHIYNKTGLLGWKQIMEQHRGVTVTLEKEYIENGVIDFGHEIWESISAFSGTFDGNGVTIENLMIAEEGFIANNNGTIRNLTLKNPGFSSDIATGTGTLAAVNNSVIENCIIEGLTATVTKPAKVGGLVGQNAQGARIENSGVVSGTITLRLNVGDAGNANLGGLVGENYSGTGMIINSFVGAVAIIHPTNSAGASNVGGLVGYNNLGKIKGCYSLAEMTINCSAQAGGLIGVNANGTALASYAAGTISGRVANNTGGLIGFNNGGTTIVTACYATTLLSATTSNSGKFGAFMGTNSGNAVECYFINETVNNATGNNSSNGIAKVTAESLRSKVRYLNLAIEEAEPGFGFNFKVNEDAGTNTLQPLVLQPAVSVPGFGGSDFGDGGDI